MQNRVRIFKIKTKSIFVYQGRVLESLGKKMEKFLGLCYFLYLSKCRLHGVRPVTAGHEEVEVHSSWLSECAGAAHLSVQFNYMRRFFS